MMGSGMPSNHNKIPLPMASSCFGIVCNRMRNVLNLALVPRTAVTCGSTLCAEPLFISLPPRAIA